MEKNYLKVRHSLHNIYIKKYFLYLLIYQTERERQIEQIRERVNRIKHERTIVTPTTPPADNAEGGGGQDAASFADMAQSADHDKMEKLAKDMENKFKEAQVRKLST